MSVVTKRCKLCLYYCNYDGHYVHPTCDYFLKTGTRRGCPAGDDCDKFLPTEECVKFTDAVIGIVKLPIRNQMLLDLYEQGLSDSEISRRAGCSRRTVAAWRKKCGLPSQQAQRGLGEGEP